MQLLAVQLIKVYLQHGFKALILRSCGSVCSVFTISPFLQLPIIVIIYTIKKRKGYFNLAWLAQLHLFSDQ